MVTESPKPEAGVVGETIKEVSGRFCLVSANNDWSPSEKEEPLIEITE
jgi:hypothetical protein